MKVILTVMKQLKQLKRKPRKYSEASMGFEPMASAWKAGQGWIQFIPAIWKNETVYMIKIIYVLQVKNTSESDPHSYEAIKAVAKKAKEKKSNFHQLPLVLQQTILCSPSCNQCYIILYPTTYHVPCLSFSTDEVLPWISFLLLPLDQVEVSAKT